jgi:hypothetical protein
MRFKGNGSSSRHRPGDRERPKKLCADLAKICKPWDQAHSEYIRALNAYGKKLYAIAKKS